MRAREIERERRKSAYNSEDENGFVTHTHTHTHTHNVHIHTPGTRSLMIFICGRGYIFTGLDDVSSGMGDMHASVLEPLTFIEQEPHIPSRQDLRKVRVESVCVCVCVRVCADMCVDLY